MTDVILKTGTEEEFFRSGRLIAQLADQRRPLNEVRNISFEEPAELLQLLTPERVALFRSIKERPGSISEISQRPHRGLGEVKRDIDQFAKLGLVVVEQRDLPGHERMEVSVAAQIVKLEAVLG
jgi:predicted transcriptional regulator